MANRLDNLSIQDLNDDLELNAVLITSLDAEGDDYVARLSELEDEKARLEGALQSKENAAAITQTQSNMNGSALPNDDSWWQEAASNPVYGGPSSNHATMGGLGSNPLNPMNFESSTAPFTNGHKRTRPQSSYLDYEQSASKRLTPEPSNSGIPMQLPREAYHSSERQSSENARLRQAHAEAAIRSQHERHEADAAYARQLDQSNYPSSSSSNFPSSSRPSFQTTFNFDGSYRPQPTPQTMNSSPSVPPPRRYPQPNGYTHEQAYAQQSHAPAQHIKSEGGYSTQQPQQLVQRPRQPAAVVDLTGSDSEDDDDLAEIAPANFTPNQRRPLPSANGLNALRSLHTPTPTTMQLPTMMNMPGAFPSDATPGSHVYRSAVANGGATNGGMMNGRVGTPGNGYNNSFLARSMNTVHNASTTLDGQLRELGNLVTGSSSARPVDLDNDDDDVIFGGSRQLPAFGNYTGNEDLYRTRYDAFQNYDPMKSKEEIEALLANIRPDEELPAHLRVRTPADMNVSLHKYQELGLTWLKQCEEGTNKGGILADDMGLGKTIQMLALMVERKSEDQRCKTTLIVAPVALMRQWRQEIHNKLKFNRRLRVFTHHGSKKAKDFNELRQYDVVLTTYGSIASETKKQEKFRLRQAQDREARPNNSEKCVFLDPSALWYRVILDEAQCIKNRNTQTAKGACMLRAMYRFCVTGTPMMNNVEEFFSLIRFLRIKPYCQWEKFRLDINMPLRSAHDDVKGKAMQMLQALCKAVMLRRTKKSTFEGKPILVLPERSTDVDNPVFSEDEQDFYKALEARTQIQFNKYLRRGQIGSSYSAILVLLLRLRQACCHPHLIKDFGVAAAADLQEDQMLEFARSLDPSVVARIKETGGNFECPVCYDSTTNPAIFIPCGHDTCSECFTRIADPTNGIQNGEENAGARCPNCRGSIDAKRLTDFHSFKKIHMPELLTPEEQAEMANGEEEVEEDSETEDSDDEEEEDELEDETLGGFVVPDGVEDGDETDDDLDRPANASRVKYEEGVAGPSNSRPDAKKPRKKKAKGKKNKADRKGKGKEKKKKSAVTLAELKAQASRNKGAKKQYLRRLRKDWVSSAKIDKTMEILEELMDAKEGEKILIFSQWTSLLDLLEIPIDGKDYKYRRYDGSMSAQMRGDAVDDFRDEEKNVRIMLVSLKAGNAGLNLNMASQVIILDPFWNPYIEEQAIDRAHRLGQTRPVKVHRVLIQETVEDRIIALQEKKRALISEALDEQQSARLGRLGVQELAYLFGVTHDPSTRINYVPREQRQ